MSSPQEFQLGGAGQQDIGSVNLRGQSVPLLGTHMVANPGHR